MAAPRQSSIESPIEPRPAPAGGAATRERLLDTAERLFVELGYDKVTARMINAEARCNPAAIHYHFGSKEGLVTELLETRLMNGWQAYKHGFQALEQRADPTVEEVVALAVVPLAQRVAEGGVPRLHVHLLARVYLGNWDVRWRSRYFDYEPWVQVLERALPDVDPGELRVRWDLAVRLNLMTLGDPLAATIEDRAVDVGALCRFVEAGLRRPSR